MAGESQISVVSLYFRVVSSVLIIRLRACVAFPPYSSSKMTKKRKHSRNSSSPGVQTLLATSNINRKFEGHWDRLNRVLKKGNIGEVIRKNP